MVWRAFPRGTLIAATAGSVLAALFRVAWHATLQSQWNPRRESTGPNEPWELHGTCKLATNKNRASDTPATAIVCDG
jgi:hypothetical protein